MPSYKPRSAARDKLSDVRHAAPGGTSGESTWHEALDRITVEGSSTPTLDLAGQEAGLDWPVFTQRFWTRVFSETLDGAARALVSIDEFIGNLGPHTEDFLGQWEAGRQVLAFFDWTDRALQGHGTMKYGYVDYNPNWDGKHIDEDDGVMQASREPGSHIVSKDDIPTSYGGGGAGNDGGGGGFGGLRAPSMEEIYEFLDEHPELVEQALQYAVDHGLLERPTTPTGQEITDLKQAGGDANATDPISTTTVTRTDVKEDGTGDLTPDAHGQFSVKNDGSVDNGHFDGHASSGGDRPDLTGIPLPKGPWGIDLRKLFLDAPSYVWPPDGWQYKASTNLAGDTPFVSYQTALYNYPDGRRILQLYFRFPAQDVSGWRLLKDLEPGAPLPQGTSVTEVTEWHSDKGDFWKNPSSGQWTQK